MMMCQFSFFLLQKISSQLAGAFLFSCSRFCFESESLTISVVWYVLLGNFLFEEFYKKEYYSCIDLDW